MAVCRQDVKTTLLALIVGGIVVYMSMRSLSRHSHFNTGVSENTNPNPRAARLTTKQLTDSSKKDEETPNESNVQIPEQKMTNRVQKKSSSGGSSDELGISNEEAAKRKSCQTLGYAETNPFPLTSLCSYPGSGNTWVRHLIQQATGN